MCSVAHAGFSVSRLLYRPPLKPATALLWGGPVLILLAGAVLFLHLGTSPQSDILVHALGFAFGIPAGMLAALWPENQLKILNRAGWFATAAVILLPWIRLTLGQPVT